MLSIIHIVGIRVRSGRKGQLLGTQECCLQMTHRATHFILYLAEYKNHVKLNVSPCSADV